MKLSLLIVAISLSFGENLSTRCVVAIHYATKIHMRYVDGNATITESYNATEKAEKICGFKLK